MKSVAKVFAVLSIVGYSICLFVLLILALLLGGGFFTGQEIASETDPNTVTTFTAGQGVLYAIFCIVGCLFLIIPLVINAKMISKLNKAKHKEELKTIGVLAIIFGDNLISGIMCLCIRDIDLIEN